MEMMSDGDDSMKKIMLEMLLEELPQEIQKLEALCGTSDWSEVNSVSHKLKSTLAFVGNDDMTNTNKNIEIYTKNHNELDKIPNLVQQLKSIYPNTITELNQELNKL